MSTHRHAGHWRASDGPSSEGPFFTPNAIASVLERIREPLHVVADTQTGAVGVALGGAIDSQPDPSHSSHALLGTLAPLYPEWLGDRSFNETHRVRFAYIAGEMANGIATVAMVQAMARAEMLGFFGAAGLSYERVEAAVNELVATLHTGTDSTAWGVNLIHSPNESALEERVADLLIRKEVPLVSASAFMGLTPAVVRCAVAGLTQRPDGSIHRARGVFAKISRPEVAARFIAPAPDEMLRALVQRGLITEAEAQLAQHVAVAEDITLESDSGGHTDNRPLTALFPTILQLRDELSAKHGFARGVRVGAAGGLGTPSAIAAAFSLGASYVLTGSVNQAANESGLSSAGRALLAKADVADVIMAPAADMFEMGVNVQVLKRGTMFGVRAQKLYEIYQHYPSLDAIDTDTKSKLEREFFRAPIAQIWAETKAFWARRDQDELAKAEREPKHQMALVFRWYLGKASRWAIDGEASRTMDFQIWCGPAMGAFNRWTEGSFLSQQANRGVVQIALNLLEGAAVITRAQQLRSYGAPVSTRAFQFAPRPLA